MGCRFGTGEEGKITVCSLQKIYTTAAHIGIEGNEVVDQIAKKH